MTILFLSEIKHNLEERIFMESLYTDIGAYATIKIRKFTCTCQKVKEG